MLRGCPPAPRARTDECAAQWAAMRDVEATLRLRRHGVNGEPAEPSSAAAAAAASVAISVPIAAGSGVDAADVRATMQEMKSAHEQQLLEMAEIRKENLEIKQMCLHLQKQNAKIQRPAAATHALNLPLGIYCAVS